MKLTKENIVGDFMIALEHLTNYKPKVQLLAHGSIKRTFPWFPVVGTLTGYAIMLPCYLIYTLVAPSIFMALACGVLYAGLAHYLEVNKGINALLKLAKIYSGKKYESEFRTFASEYLSLIVTGAVMTCKVLMPAVMLYHNLQVWLILPFLLSSASVGSFATLVKRKQLQLSEVQVNYVWMVTIVISILTNGIFGFAIAGSVIFGLKQMFAKIFKQDESIQYLLLTALNEILFCIVLLAGSLVLI